MKYYVLLAIVSLFPYFSLEGNVAEPPKGKILNGSVPFEVFESEYGNYSIDFPSTWEILPNYLGLDVVGLAPADGDEDRFRENVNIVFVELDEEMDPKEFYAKNFAFLKELLTDFNQEYVGMTKIDGVDSKWIKYSHRIGSVDAKVLQYLLLKGKKAYVITCTASPDAFKMYNPIFQKIVGSMTFTQPQTE